MMGMRVSKELEEKILGMTGADAPTKPAKYRNQKIAGFDSKKEYRRWNELKVLESVGKVVDLQRQVEFRLEVHGQLICKYKADFTYVEAGALVVEDVKSTATRRLPAYRIKAKLMLACHGIKIKET